MDYLDVKLTSNFINEFSKFVNYNCIIECDGCQESHIKKMIDVIEHLMVNLYNCNFFNFFN